MDACLAIDLEVMVGVATRPMRAAWETAPRRNDKNGGVADLGWLECFEIACQYWRSMAGGEVRWMASDRC